MVPIVVVGVTKMIWGPLIINLSVHSDLLFCPKYFVRQFCCTKYIYVFLCNKTYQNRVKMKNSAIHFCVTSEKKVVPVHQNITHTRAAI